MAQKQYPITNNFSKGELSSRMEGRVDIQGYYNGCKIMENCIMVAQGGAEKRPGTVYLGEVHDTGLNTSVRLIPFEVNDDEIYIVEMGHNYLRIWDVQSKELIADPVGSGNDYIETEYDNRHIPNIQYAQTEGVLFFAHNEYVVKRLDKTSTGFTFRDMGFNVNEYDATVTYERGEVVAYLGVYYIAQRTVLAETPAIGEWERVGTVPPDLTASIPVWTLTGYSIGDYVVYNEALWQAIKTVTTQKPGQPEYGEEAHWYEDTFIFDPREFGYSIYDYLNDTYGAGEWEILSVNPIDLSGPVSIYSAAEYKITYNIPDFVPVEYWVIKAAAFPDIPTAHPVYKEVPAVTGTYDENDYIYDSVTFELYRSLKGSNSDPMADSRDWDIIDGNPLFNEAGDYPAALTFMGSRLYLGGTKNKPQSIFASKIGNYNNFTQGLDDDDSFSFTIAADRSSRIKWMVAKDVLMLGTTSSEWLVLGGAAGITPTNVQILRQSAYGSAYQQAIFVADTLLFFQKGGRKLREYMYSNDNKAYLANDLTFFADHMTERGVIESTYQQNPDSILWSVKQNGELIGLTYDRLNQIAGWHKHNTQGLFESVASVDGSGDEDELWFIVSRIIGGVKERYIEYMNPRDFGRQSNAVFADSAYTQTAGSLFSIVNVTWTAPKITVKYTGSADFANGDHVKINFTGVEDIDNKFYKVGNLDDVTNKTFDLYVVDTTDYYTTDTFTDPETGTILRSVKTITTGIDHLEGKEVVILGDGAVFPPQTVTSGVITLTSDCNVITVGLAYIMRLQPESIEIPGAATLAANRRISKATLKVYKTLGGYVGPDEDNLEEMRFRSTTVPFGTPPSLFTGTKSVDIDAPSEQEASILVYHAQPLPMTVLAIISDITYSRS